MNCAVKMIKAAVIGATGYSGATLISILANHKDVEIVSLTSKSYVGKKFSDIYKNFKGMVELELSCNGRKVISYRADGVIAASATGSTAYSMSAGGPIIDSSLGIVEITPICAHSLKVKPIVFSGTSCLDITLLSDDCEAALSVDGAPSAILEKGDRLTVTVSDKTTKLISLSNNFCDVLYNKMNDK